MTGKTHLRGLMVAVCLAVAGWLSPSYAQQPDRSSLPIPDTQYKFPGKVPLDARDAKFPAIKELRPPHVERVGDPRASSAYRPRCGRRLSVKEGEVGSGSFAALRMTQKKFSQGEARIFSPPHLF